MEQDLRKSIADVRDRAEMKQHPISSSFAERFDIWFELTSKMPQNSDLIDFVTAVREQSLGRRPVRNLIVHGLQAGDSMPDEGGRIFAAPAGGYEQPTSETIC